MDIVLDKNDQELVLVGKHITRTDESQEAHISMVKPDTFVEESFEDLK
jgi:hypothetical protein